jgi:hypothetical protein
MGDQSHGTTGQFYRFHHLTAAVTALVDLSVLLSVSLALLLVVLQTVHSLDLVAAAPGVIACNMAHTPLDTGSCDVAVFRYVRTQDSLIWCRELPVRRKICSCCEPNVVGALGVSTVVHLLSA